MAIALNFLAGCCFLAGCRKADVWVAGGGFLQRGSESSDGSSFTLSDQQPKMDTQALLVNSQNPGFLDLLFDSTTPTLDQLWVPPGTGGVQEYDVSGAGPYSPNTISTSGKIAVALAKDDQYVYAAHPFDGAVSVIDWSKLAVTSVITLGSGRQPSLIAKGVGLYVISNSDLVKLSGSNSPAELGSANVDPYASDIAAGQGYVVVPNVSTDKIYVFVDDTSQGNPRLWWTINTENGSPYRVAISRNSATAYVTLMTGTEGTNPGLVDVLDLQNRQVTAHIQVGACPSPIAVTQVQLGGSYQDSSVLVGNQCDSTLSRIDVSSQTVVQTIPLPGVPNAIATN